MKKKMFPMGKHGKELSVSQDLGKVSLELDTVAGELGG